MQISLENFPEHLHKTAVDNLLAHRDELYEQPSTARNYGETFAHYLMLSDYRRDEQLDAMQQCLEGFHDTNTWTSTATSAYCIFGSNFIGAFMNWNDLPVDQAITEWQRFFQGCNLSWRFMADPYGHWVNVIHKRPEELLGHPQYDESANTLQVRNMNHWSRSVVDILTEEYVPWTVRPESNSGVAEWICTLTRNQLASLRCPHLKATWNGSYNVSLNGVPIKKVRYNLTEVPAGWHIPHDAARTLRVGENHVQAVYTGPGKWPTPGAPVSASEPFLRLGLIDWR